MRRAQIPSEDFGGHGPAMVFLHANGYPPACYRPLLERLATRHHVIAMLLRPLWPGADPAGVSSWSVFSEDLLAFIRQRRLRDAVIVGHSLGAITALRAALSAPGEFAALVLVEPVLLPRRVMIEWNLARMLGLGSQLHPLIRTARKRRRAFETLQQAFDGYRRREVFQLLTDEALWTLVEGLTKPDGTGGFALKYSPEWEARVYYTGILHDWDLWSGLAQLKIPTLMLRGALSDTFVGDAARDVRRRNPGIIVSTIDDATHLLPLERPDDVLELTETFLGRAPRQNGTEALAAGRLH